MEDEGKEKVELWRKWEEGEAGEEGVDEGTGENKEIGDG